MSQELPRVLITGSREWPYPTVIENVLDDLWNEIGPYILVHGAARGADTIGSEHHEWNMRPTEAHPANWTKYGKRAGYIRNATMVERGADICVAFIYEESRGATMCANLAEKAGIETRRYTA